MKQRKLQVFISSTFTDLREERQAAVSAVLKAGHIPAGMELFTAADQSQMTTIKEWIDESDVYMLILGGRYGSVEPTTGISYTELEYDYAIEQRKALFAVVVEESTLEERVKERGTQVIEKENPKQLQQFREKVLGNISSFFRDMKDIRLSVYESLADFAANRDLKGWVSADEIVDTKALVEEIQRLNDQNKTLSEEISTLRKTASATPKQSRSGKQDEFDELLEVLQGIEVKIPAKITSEKKERTTNLMDLFYGARDTLISGVTNQFGASDVNTFYYFNVLPKLQVHGLAENEKVAGVQYRRSAISPLGREFLAHVDRKIHRVKTNSAPTQMNVPPALESTHQDSASDATGGEA